MKHTKKFIAVGAALTLAMSSMTAFAADLEIGGDVDYVNTTIYKLTLPTTEGMSFRLDPQGLASLDGEGASYDSTKAGLIVGDGTMTAKNESSVDVKLSSQFYIVDSTEKAEDRVKLVASTTGITKDGDNKESTREIALTITSDDKDTTTTTDPVIDVIKSTAADATGADFTMKAATYEFKKTADGYVYEKKSDSAGSTVEMTIGGKIAKDADWSAYSKAGGPTITLHAVFEFKNADGSAIDVTPATTSISGSAYSRAKKDNTYTITWGADVPDASRTIKSVRSAVDKDMTQSPVVLDSSVYSLSGTTLTVDGTNGPFGTGAVGAKRYLEVTFDNGTKIVIEVNVTA